MSDNKRVVDEGLLDKVTGGLFDWYKSAGIMKYTHDDGTITEHKVKDFQKAWARSNEMHADFISEDVILADLISKGYIEG